MSNSNGDQQTTVAVENIGGIEESTVSFTPGVTVLSGRNATNRTSFLKAVKASCGSDNVSIKADASDASVTLTIGDETYTREFTRENGAVISSGEPLIDDDVEVADLFAFLLESNEARQAVARGDDLREIIMRPVDTEEIHNEIDQLVAERDEIDRTLEEIESQKRRLPNLEEKRTSLRNDASSKREELDEITEELEDTEIELTQSKAEQETVEKTLEELQQTRSKLEDVRYELETERESLNALRDERTDVDSDLEEVSDTPDGNIDVIETQVNKLRNQKQQLDEEINELHSLIQFNEGMLEDEQSIRLTNDDQSIQGEQPGDAGAVTNQLIEEEEQIQCWTCGSTVEESQIESTVESLQQTSRQKFDERSSLESELDELQREKRELEQTKQRRERLERRRRDLESQIDQRESAIDRLQDQRETLGEEIDQLETEIEEAEDDTYSELLAVHRNANELEFELDRIEDDLASVESEIASIEDRLAERAQLEDDRSAISGEIEKLRTRIEEIETKAIEAFNDHMQEVLDILDYENLERIWLERLETADRSNSSIDNGGAFELHIVRSTESGATYEDTVDNLSESEREVTGLVFALAGYLVHQVHETVPFMLLDSVEAIDSERIATLVEYFKQYPDYLLIALLPEDAAALEEDYERVSQI